MATETIATLTNILKDKFLPALNSEVASYDAIADIFTDKSSDAEWSGDGRKAITYHEMAWQEGVGAIGDGANLPTPGLEDIQQGAINMKFLYGSFELTGPSMILSDGKNSYVNALTLKMNNLKKRLKKELGRIIWGTGSGRLALATAAVAANATTIPVNTPGGFTGTYGARFLRKGMIILVTNDNATIAGVTTVTAVDPAGLTVTVSPGIPVALVAGAIIYRVSTTGATSFAESSKDNEPDGILKIVSDASIAATFETLSRATYPQLNSTVDTAVGAITLDRINRNFDVASQKSDDIGVDCLACHHSVRRAILTQLQADRRYTNELLRTPDVGIDAVTKGPKKGTYVTFGGVPIIESTNAPYDTLVGLDKGSFTKYTRVEGDFADEDGAVLSRIAGTDKWGGFYRKFYNMTGRPKNNFLMTGITSTAVYVAQN